MPTDDDAAGGDRPLAADGLRLCGSSPRTAQVCVTQPTSELISTFAAISGFYAKYLLRQPRRNQSTTNQADAVNCKCGA